MINDKNVINNGSETPHSMAALAYQTESSSYGRDEHAAYHIGHQSFQPIT